MARFVFPADYAGIGAQSQPPSHRGVIDATHSIRYRDLASFFMGFSVWNARNVCLGSEETVEWFALLGVEPVPVLQDGKFDTTAIQALSRGTPRS
ncbi:RNA ligase family protein [Cupriavidus sp. 2MCAB6]|uniref:RNA ligase family protein n=1 Tax=Cupriavidus sp. 2MCAB6 TaxID=3232981 RepID=UPI003F920DDB